MKWKFGKLAKDTSLLTLGMGIRAFSQGLVFIIIARSMGADGYGGFVSLIAIAGMLSGLVGFGSHVLLTRDTALNPQKFHSAWGHTLFSLAISAPIVFIVYLLLAFFILPNEIGWMPIIFIGIADLIFWPLSNVCVSAYQGFERMGRVSRIIIAPVMMRLFAAFIFLSLLMNENIQQSMLLTWSSLYLIAAMVAASYTQWLVYKDLGKPVFSNSHGFTRIKESMPFALWASSDKLYIDADKMMLARMTSLDVTGIYSAAYRLIDIFLLPLHGLIGAATPRLFQEGNKGIHHSFVYSIKLVKLPLIYSLSVGFIIYLLANFIPLILGPSFYESIEAIRYLAWIPIMILPKILLQSILASSGFQKKGMQIVLAGAVINIISNLFLIPIMGWKGAAIATYIAEISMSLIMSILLYHLINKYSLKSQAS